MIVSTCVFFHKHANLCTCLQEKCVLSLHDWPSNTTREHIYLFFTLCESPKKCVFSLYDGKYASQLNTFILSYNDKTNLFLLPRRKKCVFSLHGGKNVFSRCKAKINVWLGFVFLTLFENYRRFNFEKISEDAELMD